MKRLLLLLFLAAPLSAQSRIRFDPPLPDSSKPFAIIGTVVLPNVPCYPSQQINVSGGTIDITIGDSIVLPGLCGQSPRPILFGGRVGPLPAGVYNIVVERFGDLVATGSVAVQDAKPPFTVTPNLARVDDQVTLNAPLFCSGGIACKNIRVFFDNIEARVDDANGTRILAMVPPHAPGVVPIAVQTPDGTLIAAAAFDYPGSDFDRQFFTPVLFPAIVSGPGAFGSIWETRVSLRNAGGNLTTGGPTLFHRRCVQPCDDRPSTNWRATVTDANAPRGFLERIPRQSADAIGFQERVRELTSGDAGASIPVIRENETTTQPFAMLDVPNDGHSRITLRVYSIDGPTIVHVGIAPADLHQRGVFATDLVLTSVGDDSDLAEAALDVNVAPESLVVFCTPGAERVAAFLSITDNETQHVTVIRPE